MASFYTCDECGYKGYTRIFDNCVECFRRSTNSIAEAANR